MKTYIVLDESGAMHLKNERYFIIAGFITNNLHKVKSAHKKIEKIIKERKGIDLSLKVELKSSKIKENQQAIFLNELYSLKGIIPIAIIVDKENLTNFNASENVAYNFFVKTLIKYLLKSRISVMNTNEIELRLDNRNTSVKTLKDLETFLIWEFDNKINFHVNYLDSRINRDIQMADYVANSLWKEYNLNNNKLKEMINNHHIFLSKFPIDYFGVNPSKKEMLKNKISIQKEVVKN